MMGVLAWMIGSEIGRKVALSLIITAALGIVVLRVYMAGRAAERAKQTERSLNNLRERIKVDSEITALPKEERRRRLEEWAR